jgi:hypothetical protein
MNITFEHKTCQSIDELVSIAWQESKLHHDEVFLIKEREDDLMKLINDEIDPSELDPFEFLLEQQIEPPKLFTSPKVAKKEIETRQKLDLVVAVDSGIIHLGDFVGGDTAFAIRGAAICTHENHVYIFQYNTGAIVVDSHNLKPLMEYMGQRLGSMNLYFTKDKSGNYQLSTNILRNQNQIQDRFRNFVERMILEEALGLLKANGKGILLVDGALSAGTYDTPKTYIESFLSESSRNNIEVVAISKKTRIRIQNIPIGSLLDEHPQFVGYIPLRKLIEDERANGSETVRPYKQITAAKDMFAVRFGLGPPALTFRVDVNSSISSTSEEVLNDVMSKCSIFGCYPKPLIDAHRYSCFFFQDVQSIIADLIVKTGAQPKEDQSMGWMFEPFGSFGK